MKAAGLPSDLKFAGNLSLLFTERPFLDRFAAAAAAGFDAVEFQFPYAFEPDAIAAAADAAGVRVVLHNLPAGDWDAGERGIACLPQRRADFRAGVERALRYARRLGVPRLNCLAGLAPAGADRAALRATLVDNLRLAADTLGEHGIDLLVESINSHDVPGFLLDGSAAALEAIDAADRPNIRLQYDVYHMQRMGEDPAAGLHRLLPRIGHIQIADAPGRHEPGTGAIDFDALFAQLARDRWDGCIGCEYLPLAGTESGLGWLRALRATAA